MLAFGWFKFTAIRNFLLASWHISFFDVFVKFAYIIHRDTFQDLLKQYF